MHRLGKLGKFVLRQYTTISVNLLTLSLTRVFFVSADCFDKNPNCQYWALRGDCKKHPEFMLATCCMWCDKVKCMYYH